MDQTTRAIVNPYASASGPLTIIADARDEDNGNASHTYDVKIQGSFGESCNRIKFQQGEKEPNGISNEALIAIVLDRLDSFNAGPYRCRENSLAITALEEALHWMHHRTMMRQARLDKSKK